MKPFRAVTTGELREARVLAAEGRTVREVAQIMGRSESTVRQWKKYGIKFCPSRMVAHVHAMSADFARERLLKLLEPLRTYQR